MFSSDCFNRFRFVNSCLIFVVGVEGREVVVLEYLYLLISLECWYGSVSLKFS